MEALEATTPMTKTSTYRQSGWRNLTTGIIEIHYGLDQPQDPTQYVKVWDNDVIENVVVTPHIS